jgi:hypothetical protein
MKIHPFTLESALSPEECVRRLRATIAEKGMGFFTFGDFGGNEQYFGRIEGDRIELRKRKLWFWRNDFAPHLFATLTPSSSGTRIGGHFGVGSRILSFMKVWMVLLIIVGGPAVVTAILRVSSGHRFDKGGDAMVSVMVVPAMLAFGFLLPRISYYFSFWHEDELLEFVKNTLAAREARVQG